MTGKIEVTTQIIEIDFELLQDPSRADVGPPFRKPMVNGLFTIGSAAAP
jgi:hypothetical protein